jgi:hypothetical protein
LQVKYETEGNVGDFIWNSFRLAFSWFLGRLAFYMIHDNEGRRSGIERREFYYDECIPERRSGGDRRRELDRRLKSRTSAN